MFSLESLPELNPEKSKIIWKANSTTDPSHFIYLYIFMSQYTFHLHSSIGNYNFTGK